MPVESNGMMGGIGAVLIMVSSISPVLVLPALFSAYPTVASTLSPFSSAVSLAYLAGIILFMVAMRRFAGSYMTPGIFDNALYGILSNIAVSVLTGFIMFTFALINFSSIMTFFNPVPTPVNIQEILGYMLPAIPVFFLAGLVQSLFMMRALNIIADKSGKYRFRTAGVALVASSMLTVILACIGVLLFSAAAISSTVAFAIAFTGTAISSLAWIFPAKAFFSLETSTSLPPSTAPNTRQTHNCPHCVTENLSGAVLCTRCGK